MTGGVVVVVVVEVVVAAEIKKCFICSPFETNNFKNHILHKIQSKFFKTELWRTQKP